MTYHIETERLILRDIRTEDLEHMFQLDSDPIVHEYLGNKPFTSKEQSKKNIQSIISQYKERGIGRWAAIEKSSGNFIGWSGLRLYTNGEVYNNKTDFYDIGYRLIPKYWGKGYATESSIAGLNHAFNKLNLDAVYGITEYENTASHKVLLKIGLKYIEDFPYEKEGMLLRWYQINKKEYEQKMS